MLCISRDPRTIIFNVWHCSTYNHSRQRTACGCNAPITNWVVARYIQQVQMCSSGCGVSTEVTSLQSDLKFLVRKLKLQVCSFCILHCHNYYSFSLSTLLLSANRCNWFALINTCLSFKTNVTLSHDLIADQPCGRLLNWRLNWGLTAML